MVDGCDISCEIAPGWSSLNVTDDTSTLAQVMAWCRQATSHFTWTSVSLVLCHHMTSLSYNELILNFSIMIKFQGLWRYHHMTTSRDNSDNSGPENILELFNFGLVSRSGILEGAHGILSPCNILTSIPKSDQCYCPLLQQDVYRSHDTFIMSIASLTHWGRDKMAAIFQTIFSKCIFSNENVWI